MLTMDAGVIARAVLLVAEQERKAHLAREYVERFRQRLEVGAPIQCSSNNVR